MITQSELKSLFLYNPKTGIFTRIVVKTAVSIGSIAGTKTHKRYIVISISYKKYQAHRLAWLYVYGIFPKYAIDHINGIRSDNRIDNLREATTAQNNMNSVTRCDNTSGIKGVSFFKSRNKWRADASFKGKQIYLGSFDSKADAASAYQAFSKLHHGEFYHDTSYVKPSSSMLQSDAVGYEIAMPKSL